MTAAEIVKELETLGRPSHKKTFLRHGIKEPLIGVPIADLKKIQKRIKKDYRIALDLYDTGIYDAMYLAGLIADDMKMTKKDLQKWVTQANCDMLCGFTVAWVTAESPHGWELGREWIDSPKQSIACAGWSTLASLVAVKDDDDLDIPGLKKLLQRVEKTIHQAPDRVRYNMNGFVIALGSYVPALTNEALKAAAKIGKVEVDMGDTDCRVPDAATYIKKVQDRGTIGKKRKSAKC